MSRDTRRLMNSVEPPQSFSDGAPASSLQEGGTMVSLDKGKLSIRRKHKGIVFKSYMSRDGNEFVDKKLTTSELEYKRKFVDYRVFIHNFNVDIATNKYYLPWGDSFEQTSMDKQSTGFITPFKMTLHKIIIRPDNVTASADVTIRVEKEDEGDNTEDVIATAIYDVSEAGAIQDDTNFELKKSDFDNDPTIESGKLAGLSIQAASDIVGSAHSWFVTSVWKTFIEI